ncbi:MAG: hypothetical protein RLO17_15355 [Cyclobacteriaceae bacterium]
MGSGPMSLWVDEFNDHMGIAYLDDFGNETLLLFKATTRPG